MSERSDSQPLDGIGAVAEAFRGAMVRSMDAPTAPPSAVRELLAAHLGEDPRALDAVTDVYDLHLYINLQVALNELLAEPGRTHRTVGVHCPSHRGQPGEVSLSLLLSDTTLAWSPIEFVPAEYQVIQSSCTDTLSCLKQGMVLFEDEQGPGVIFVRGERGRLPQHRQLMVDVMCPSAERATEVITRLRDRGVALSPYRGQVIEIGYAEFVRTRQIRFLPRPEHTEADQVILPKGLLEEIEDHSINVFRNRDVLEASGRHFKRGLLLHGRPGTGKTHTIRYLISQLPEATVVVMSGRNMVENFGRQPLELILKMVELIVPGIVILDDVDFIAEDRSMPGMTRTREELFSLLEVLDGIDEDADLLFVLTTNRPNMLEPAVAARPGRIDQAIEVPLPDADCRRRLLELYTRELTFEAGEADIASFVERTEGVTASFIRELVRRAAAAAALADRANPTAPVVVTAAGLAAALDELIDPAKPLTALLLGAEPEHAQPILAQIKAPS